MGGVTSILKPLLTPFTAVGKAMSGGGGGNTTIINPAPPPAAPSMADAAVEVAKRQPRQSMAAQFFGSAADDEYSGVSLKRTLG